MKTDGDHLLAIRRGCERRGIGTGRLLRYGGILLVLWALMSVLPGCRKSPARESGPATVWPPRLVRIATTVPAATQILLQIKAGNMIAGVSSFDRGLLPKSLQSLPIVGNYLHLDYETILNIDATALVVQISPARLPLALTAFASDNHIALVDVQLNTLGQVYQTAKVLAAVSGHTLEAAQAITKMKSRLSALQRQYARGTHPRVVFLIGTKPLMAVGKNTFLDQLIRLAGGNNVGEKLGSGYPSFTRETLLELKPQVLLIGLPGQPPAQGPDDPRLMSWLKMPLPAARQHRIYLVTDRSAQLPTLATYKTAALLGRLIHGVDDLKKGSR